MSRLRLGLIGAGPWGRNIINTLAGLPDAALTRVASRNPATQALVDAECRVSEDWREVAQARDLDGVIIAAPPPLHAEMARASISAGLPTLVEKPLTMDLKEAQGLLALAQSENVFVLVDHTHLFHPAYEALKERARRLGPVQAIASAGGSRGPFREDISPLWDYGAHDVALCLDLLGGKPVEIKAARERRETLIAGVGENIRLELGFPGEVKADILIGNLLPRKTRTFAVRFAAQTLVMDDQKADKLVLHENAGGSQQSLPVPSGWPLTRAVESFLAAIRSSSRDLAGLRLGVDVVAILETCGQTL